MISPLDQDWPAEDLEKVEACPYCGARERKLAYGDVQDWSFHCAPGKWNYWDCENCGSLYVDPRPSASSIGLAYAKYYTHGSDKPATFAQTMKTRLRNECLSQKLGSSIEPRLHLPKLLDRFVTRLGSQVAMPFGWMLLASQPKGQFLDVGCGAGLTVAIAQQLGWDAMGIEIDPVAVREAQRSGLKILEGTYEHLAQYEGKFDCIMCSHVLEHVHEPLDLLVKLKVALKPGGTLLLTLPNSLSAMRYQFGANWRGLEAPRHLSIPSEPQLMHLLVQAGFCTQLFSGINNETAAESYRIERRALVTSRQDMARARQLRIEQTEAAQNNDFIKLICVINSDQSK